LAKAIASFFENKIYVLLGLILPALLLYFKSLSYGFSPMDEQWMILKNSSFLNDWNNIKNAFTKPMAEIYYRPLFMVSLIIDYHLGKLSPFIYHFTNLFFHLSCVVLLYKYLVLIQVQKKLAFSFGLLFSLHPIMLHAVAWIPGRNDVMLCFFVLLSLIYLQKFISENKLQFIFLHFLFFGCALFTKENAIVLPLIYCATYFTFKDFKSKKIIKLIVLWFIVCVLWFVLRYSIVNYMLPIETNFISSIKNFVFALILFIGKAFLPFQQSVLPTIKNSNIIFGLMSLFAIAFMIYKLGINNSKIAFLGIFIFFSLLAIPIWFGATKSSGEHYEQRIYTSIIGLFLFLSTLKINIYSKTFNYFIIIAVCWFAIKTFIRMDVYKSALSYANCGIKECPNYYLFYVTKGEDYYSKKEYNNALTFFSEAIKLRPDKADIFSNRASTYFKMGLLNEAIFDYSSAINKSKFRAEYYLNRCIVYNKVNDNKNAIKDLQVLQKCCSDLIPQKLKEDVLNKNLIITSHKY